jgi:preprotein translocase subunit SecE
MDAQTTAETTGKKDVALLLLAIAAMLAGIVGYYWFDDKPLLVRTVFILLGLAAGAGIMMLTWYGKQFWAFATGSRIELRKVVWPEREDTMRMTMVVFAFTILMGVFFFVLDLGLSWLTRWATGAGG